MASATDAETHLSPTAALQGGSGEWLPPVAADEGAPAWFSERRQRQLIWGFLLLGLAARALRYFLNFPLWDDESFLCVNFIDRDYGQLLERLDYDQVAPILFLWIELTMVKLFGFSEMSLRAFAFGCSVASLFLFRHLASRLLSGVALVAAVAIFSVSYPGIRYAAEAKQYGSNLFVTLLLLTLAVEWWRRPQQWRWPLLLMALLPGGVLLSYPALFAAAGISLCMASVLLQRARRAQLAENLPWLSLLSRREWFPWIGYNVALLASAAVVIGWASRRHSAGSYDTMHGFWAKNFLPIGEPWRIPGWLLDAHTGELFSIPIGGQHGASSATTIVVLLALGLMARLRRWRLMLFCLAPLAMNLIASAMQRYPYGGHIKFSQHLAPVICLMGGLGVAVAVGLIARWGRHGRLVTTIAFCYFLLVGLGSMARDLYQPYKTVSDLRDRDFARWYWENNAFDGEVACVRSDLGQNFSPELRNRLNWGAMYACNKRIYDPRGGRPNAVQFDRISEDWPLRCLLYRDPELPFDEPAFQRWLAEMESRYDLVSADTYCFPRYGKRRTSLLHVDYVQAFKFVPKRPADAQTARRPQTSLPR